MLITATIDATENRDVSVIYAPGAFLTADMDEEVIVRLENKMVDAMLEIDNEIYGKCVIYRKNGKKYMYVSLRKEMYVTLKEEILYYRNISRELKEYGFVINPYNPCVARKWTNNGQLTVVCHVDDTKVSRNNKKEARKFIDYTKGIYGNNMPAVRGKKHTYYGMDLDYSTPREVIVYIYSYIKEAINEFPEEMIQK